MATSSAKKFSTTRFIEVRTGRGQLLWIQCIPEDADKVREIFASIAALDIEEPETHRVNVPHGGYGRYTRYDIVQHKYAGGGGYVEVLEVKNSPDLRCGIVIHEWNPHDGSVFTEWETVEDAVSAFDQFWGSPHRTADSFSTLKGFKRYVHCGALTPWFYAIGTQELVGDYAFPEDLQDDLVFSFGKQFVVTDYDGIPSVKTCMGTRSVTRKRDYYPYEEYHARLVYWDDGSTWDEQKHPNNLPRPLEEGEFWIGDAMRRFRELLAGGNTNFRVDFTNGVRFIGRVVAPKSAVSSPEGRYDVVAHIRGGKLQKGWVDFTPTPKHPNVVSFVTAGLAARGMVVERVEVKEAQTTKKGKKWAGVFFVRKTS